MLSELFQKLSEAVSEAVGSCQNLSEAVVRGCWKLSDGVRACQGLPEAVRGCFKGDTSGSF